MAQADFAYQAANDAAGMVLGVSIFADRAHLREQIREDAEMAGFRTVGCAGIDALLDGAHQLTLGLAADNIFDVVARRHSSLLKDYAPLAGRDVRLTLRFAY